MKLTRIDNVILAESNNTINTKETKQNTRNRLIAFLFSIYQ